MHFAAEACLGGTPLVNFFHGFSKYSPFFFTVWRVAADRPFNLKKAIQPAKCAEVH
jgi:hypothetical protein